MSTHKHTSESAIETFLRPEARAFTWEKLTESQRDAFDELSSALSTAVNAIASRPARSWSSVDELRNNQTIMLAADRGMGKTSLMLSLQDAIRPDSTWDIDKMPVKDQHIAQRVLKLRRRVIWLDTLDMEPLSGPTNLMVAILARVERAVSRMAGRSEREYGMLNPAVGSEKDLLDLKRLSTDASLAWDGNVRERASNLDPDSFASEVMRAEQARLSINERFHDILNRLAQNVQWKEYGNPLFVLPVDDFDLNPTRCLELLRLIRALTVPRLFTLVLGDDNVAEEVFKLKMAGDFARVADIRIDAQNLYQTDFFTRMWRISAHALRKLLPPAQRVKLRHLKITESLNYCPESGADSMQDVLGRWRLDLELPLAEPHRTKGESAVKTLADFLLIQPFVPEKNELQPRERVVYTACRLLEGPPREIADLWFTLQKRSEGGRDALIEHARRWASEALVNDTGLPIRERLEIAEAVRNSGMNNSLDTKTLDVAIFASPGPRLVLPAEPAPKVILKVNYLQETRMHYRVTQNSDLKDQRPDKKTTHFMDRRTQGYVTLLHDLISLGVNVPIVGDWLLKGQEQYDLASVSWRFPQETINVQWHGFIFRSLWEQDRFADGWYRFASQRFSQLNWESHFAEDIALHWIGLCAALLTGNKYVGPWKEPPETPVKAISLNKRVKPIVTLAEQMVGDTERFGIWRRNQALIGLALMLSFEGGVPLEVAEPFWESEKLLHFWETEAATIRAHRARNVGLTWSKESFLEYRWSLVNPRTLISQSRKKLGKLFATPEESSPSLGARKLDAYLEKFESQESIVASSKSRSHLTDAMSEMRDHITRYEYEELRESLDLIINFPDLIQRSLRHPSNSIEQGKFCPTAIDRSAG
jgi:hypothetical protein